MDGSTPPTPPSIQRTERTFLIQRYATSNWPQVKGDVPFLATGPLFSNYGYGLERFNEWRFAGELERQFQDAYGEFGQDEGRYYAAWALLDTGIVQALWAGHSPIPDGERWSVAVDQLAREIPSDTPIGESVIEYLSGLSAPGHFRSYVSEDQISLDAMEVPGAGNGD